jgi:hypothetical protein
VTNPDRESRFDQANLTMLDTAALVRILDAALVARGHPDPFAARAWALRVSDLQRELAIRNRRETERQDDLPPIPEAAAPTASADVRADVRAYAIKIIGGYLGAGLSSATTEAVADAIAGRAAALVVLSPDSADRVRAVVREAFARVSDLSGAEFAQRHIEDIATRVAAQLTAPAPGHVCPVPYGLGPEDLERIETTRAVMARFDFLPQIPELISTLDKILAAHRAPEATIRPLPEVIQCGTPGCPASIRKTMLPSGWLLRDGAWACPRCKVLATQEAS